MTNKDKESMNQQIKEIKIKQEIGELNKLITHMHYINIRLLCVQFKQIRIFKKLPLSYVAKKAKLSRWTVRQLENGHTLNPSLDTLFRYAQVLNIILSLEIKDYEKY